jgi:hypothetical protein
MRQKLFQSVSRDKDLKLFDRCEGTHFSDFHEILKKIFNAEIFGYNWIGLLKLRRRESFLKRRFKGAIGKGFEVRV